MEFGKGVIFILTREDIVDDKFLHDIKDGVGDLVAIEIKKFMREITG